MLLWHPAVSLSSLPMHCILHRRRNEKNIPRKTNENTEEKKEYFRFRLQSGLGRYTLFSNPTCIEWIWLCRVWSGRVKSEIVSGNRYERAQTHSCRLTFYHVAAAGSLFFLSLSLDWRTHIKKTSSTRGIFKARIEKYTFFTHIHTGLWRT